jgi:hypothetical protein
LFRILTVCLAATASGCGARSPLERAGVDFQAPAPWRAVKAQGILAPGRVLGAWEGPESARLVLYQTLPTPGTDVRALIVELANRLGSLPEAQVVYQGQIDLGEAQAGRVDIVAPGDGHSLAPSGLGSPAAPLGTTLIPTRRVTLVIPRGGDTLWLTCHFPNSASGRFRVIGEEILKLLRVHPSSGLYSTY